jgi:ABC-type dipeptide/oligopeptide/nickel transport system permease component
LRRQLGFDRPLVVQYVNWVSRAVRGDLGRSIVTDRPVARDLRSQFRNTVELALASILVAVTVGMTLGTLAAYWRGSWIDGFAGLVAAVGVSMPSFWLGLILIFVFAFHFGLFPAVGQGTWRHLVLPAFTLGFGFSAVITRLLRSSLVEILQQEYVLVARAKGLRDDTVVLKHAVRNALIPIVTVVGMQLGDVFAGAVIVEAVFARQGLGQLLVQGILDKDIPIVQGAVLVTSISYLITNFLADVSYVFLDPRIRRV